MGTEAYFVISLHCREIRRFARCAVRSQSGNCARCACSPVARESTRLPGLYRHLLEASETIEGNAGQRVPAGVEWDLAHKKDARNAKFRSPLDATPEADARDMQKKVALFGARGLDTARASLWAIAFGLSLMRVRHIDSVTSIYVMSAGSRAVLAANISNTRAWTVASDARRLRKPRNQLSQWIIGR